MSQKINEDFKNIKKEALKEAKNMEKELIKFGKKASDYVKKNPKKTLISAIGVGTLIAAGAKALFDKKKEEKISDKKKKKKK